MAVPRGAYLAGPQFNRGGGQEHGVFELELGGSVKWPLTRNTCSPPEQETFERFADSDRISTVPDEGKQAPIDLI